MENNFNFYFKKNNLPHAIVFLSVDEMALSEASTYFCKLILCDDENSDLISKKIEHKNHADILFFPQEKDVISVDEMLKIVEEAYVCPYESNSKIFVLNNFENTSVLAQNKLLKTLEEPPQNVYFVLNVKNEQLVLPTIMSRCQKIYLPKFDNQKIQESLSEFNLTDEQKQDIISYANGAMKKAKDFALKENFFEILAFCFELLKNYKTSSKAILYAKTLYSLKDDFLLFLNLFNKILEDVIYFKLGLNFLIKNNQRLSDYEVIAKEYKINALTEISKSLSLINEKLKRNCNQNIIIDNFLMKILEEKTKWQ